MTAPNESPEATTVELALSRFLEGEPEPGDAAILAAAMHKDPALAFEVRRLLAMDELLRQAHEPDPAAFAASLQARLAAEEDGDVFTRAVLGHIQEPARWQRRLLGA